MYKNLDYKKTRVEGDPDFDLSAIDDALFNCKYFGGEIDFFPVINAMAGALRRNAQIVVPFIVLDKGFKPVPMKKLKGVDVLEKYTADQLVVPVLNSPVGGRYVPLFTSEEALKMGDDTFFLYVSFSSAWEMVLNDKTASGVVINPWSDNLPLEKEDMKTIRAHKPTGHVSIIKGDITKMHVDAIVNAANTTLLGGGGVDGAIHRAAGPKLLEECRSLNGCETGEARITRGYRLPADHVIHTVGPIYSGDRRDEELLRACYMNSLHLAKKHKLKSIAFPSISTGAYGYPIKEAMAVALYAISDWMAEHEDYLIDVYCCCFSEDDYKLYLQFVDANV